MSIVSSKGLETEVHLQFESHFSNKSRYSIANFQSGVNKWITWCEANGVHKYDLDIKNVRRFLQDSPVRYKTKQNYLSHVKTLLKLLYSASYGKIPEVNHWYSMLHEYTNKNLIGMEQEKVVRNIITVEQFHEVLEVFSNGRTDFDRRCKMLTVLMFSCGLRKTETLHLKYSDFDFHNNELLPRNQKRGKQQSTFLPDAVIKEILDYREYVTVRLGYTPEYVVVPCSPSKRFCRIRSRLNQPVGKYTIGVLFKRIHRLTGVHVTPHSCRYSFATWQHQAGVDLKSIQRSMRHEKASTTMDIYIQPSMAKEDTLKAMDDILSHKED